MPAKSVLTVTPLTARNDPTALKEGSHRSFFATAVVTAEEGRCEFRALGDRRAQLASPSTLRSPHEEKCRAQHHPTCV